MPKSTASRVHEAPLGTAGMLEGHWLAIPYLFGKYAEKISLGTYLTPLRCQLWRSSKAINWHLAKKNSKVKSASWTSSLSSFSLVANLVVLPALHHLHQLHLFFPHALTPVPPSFQGYCIVPPSLLTPPIGNPTVPIIKILKRCTLFPSLIRSTFSVQSGKLRSMKRHVWATPFQHHFLGTIFHHFHPGM